VCGVLYHNGDYWCIAGELKGREGMYESPITQILSEMQTVYEDECLKAVQRVGFDVNKEELAKALVYDRGQYEEGYADAVTEFEQRLKKICAERPLGIDKKFLKPTYLNEDGTWHSLIDDVVVQMKGEKE